MCFHVLVIVYVDSLGLATKALPAQDTPAMPGEIGTGHEGHAAGTGIPGKTRQPLNIYIYIYIQVYIYVYIYMYIYVYMESHLQESIRKLRAWPIGRLETRRRS